VTVFVTNSKENPVSEALNTWGRKNVRFRQKSPYIVETVRDRSMVTVDDVLGSWSIRVGSDDLDWLWKARR